MPDESIPAPPPGDRPGDWAEAPETDAEPLDDMPVAPLTDEDETKGG